MKRAGILLALLAGIFAPAPALCESPGQPVVLLHGLIRTEASMGDMARALAEAGFRPCNIGYPSRDHPIGALALDHVLPAIQDCVGDPGEPGVAFVAHSLGAIIVRYLSARGAPIHFGRVVMLGPPNQGSLVVDELGDNPLVEWLNGPAGKQLGTGKDSVPRSLGPTELEVGIIAGHDSINPVFSMMIPGEDDGTIAVETTRLEGMEDFITVPVSHPFLMNDDEVIRQTIHFLNTGEFQHDH